MADKQINLDKIFKGTIAVHLTDFLPKNKKIRTRFSIDPRKWFRDTIHFTLNKPVKDLQPLQTSNLKGGIWSGKKFCILIPFDKLYELNGKNLQGFGPDDTFFNKSVVLPDGTIVIITSSGIDEAIQEKVTSLDECTQYFGDPAEPQKSRVKFFEKTVNGIIYKILDYHEPSDIIKITIATIEEKGYSANFFYDKPIRDISDALGLEFISHDMHWSSSLEDFLISIHSHKENADNIPSVIVKIINLGIVFPIKIDDMNEGFIDSTGKTFKIIEIKRLTKDEKRAAECLEISMSNPEQMSSLQFPVEYAKSLLKYKKIPDTYHNAIKFYIKDYQDYVKKKLSKEIIILCPKLTEYLNEKF